MKKSVVKPGKGTVILYGACAAIWTAGAVIAAMDRLYSEDMFRFVLKAFCALIWIVAFIACLKRCRAAREE